MVKNPPANAGDIRDMCSIPGSGRSPEGGTATHSNIPAWKIARTKEPGRLQSRGPKESDTTERLHFHYLFQRTVPKVFFILGYHPLL